MIEMQHFQPLQPGTSSSSRTKRQPKPSALAASIQNFKQQQQRHQRKHKNHYQQLEDTHYESLPSAHNLNALRCVLPSGKKLSLSIIIRKKHPKKGKKRPTTQKQTVRQPQPLVTQTKTNLFGGDDLLQKFLMAAKELNKQQEQEREKIPKQSVSLSYIRDSEGEKRQPRSRTQAGESDRTARICQKGRVLSEKVQSLLSDMIYL